ncbi:cytochrome c oxidase assembly protein [Pontibacter diazotrophicus]|uniref:Cytochrome c oxidase assembly protein n=1 Tax=Pontibacter diazotrophicus TaxID=1400979 RepID=A0A3D8L2E9_9BACT|nr:cytochrome c oxidase assembly protein [Pontibacter diazotrophicus]RDV11545.1 cytochrome c oxidase assembly protein [Pontibacter diazotrophicus]
MEHHTGAGGGTLAVAIPYLLIAAALAAYLFAVARQRNSLRPWSRWRTISFIVGVSLLAVAMSPSLVRYAHHDLRGHMIQHLLIGMLAPLGLVLAAPLTLMLRTLPVQSARVVTSVLRSWAFQWLSHPVTALLLNIGGMYLLYLTPLYALTLTNPYMHHLVHLHFLAAGYLFTWSIAGPDPAPGRPAMRTRLVVLFISIAAHAYLSKFMYAYSWPRNTPHDMEQIREAAQLMYYGGDFAELLLVIILFASWYRDSSRHAYSLNPQVQRSR